MAIGLGSSCALILGLRAVCTSQAEDFEIFAVCSHGRCTYPYPLHVRHPVCHGPFHAVARPVLFVVAADVFPPQSHTNRSVIDDETDVHLSSSPHPFP